MNPLALDPGNCRGTYKLIGGRPSLDLVNTISWPGTARAHDWLTTRPNLRRWLVAVGLPDPRSARIDLGTVSDAREVLTDVLRPLAHAKSPPRRAMERLNGRIAHGVSRRAIDPVTLTWIWLAPERPLDLLAPLFVDAADLVTAVDHRRLRHCPACDWLFEDRSRNGRRRWCDMGDCGSRDKASRYYRRNR